MLRHDHVSEHNEVLLLPNFFENQKETVAGFRGSEQRCTTITREGDEVEVSVTVITLEMGTHMMRIES